MDVTTVTSDIHTLSREASLILQNGRMFFYAVHAQHLVAKPNVASYIIEMFLNKFASYS